MPPRSHWLRFSTLVLLAWMLVFAACGGDDDDADRNDGNDDSSPAPAGALSQEQAEQGFQALGLPVRFVSEDLPDGWPGDFPTYPNATLLGSIEAQAIASGVAAVYESGDGLEPILEFFRQELTAQGYTLQETGDGQRGGSLVFSSQDKGSGTVAVLQIGERFGILVRYSAPQ